MFNLFFFVICFVSTPVLIAEVVEDPQPVCGETDFHCKDGRCLSQQRVCDGIIDCWGGDDEAACLGVSNSILERVKRQAGGCRKTQWQCRDGNCISFDGKCDGVIDCPDGSDETHALCRRSTCQSNWFRCTYGACVDGTAPCNGIQDCADNSDELLPRCRNEVLEVRGQFKCENGQLISALQHCDGTADCADASDESVRACAGKICPQYLFQCAYGACVDAGSDCNGVKECYDGSDESPELCNTTTLTESPIRPPGPTPKPVQGGSCVLPPYPKNGRYVVAGIPNPTPGQSFVNVGLNITCDPGYDNFGRKDNIICYNGFWTDDITDCVRVCRLAKDSSVDYQCILSGANDGYRVCNEYEPEGTSVRPVCKAPNYYYSGVLNYMHCSNGVWNYVARCTPECGLVTPKGVQLIIGGRPAERGELPWHTGIFQKTYNPYLQICGGSLITATVVISAAHCFWKGSKPQPVSNYAVALGKLHRAWDDDRDVDVQKSDISDVKIPQRFLGSLANFQEDIALLILVQTIVFAPHIRPVCIDFAYTFEAGQLSQGNLGKVAGWGRISDNGEHSPILKVVELPYVPIGQCQAEAPINFRQYLTGDKFCAGYRNGTALCDGDSGGGLTFPAADREKTRYYLRGLVSVAPTDEANMTLCNAWWYTGFTLVSRHQDFIFQHVHNI